MLYRSERARKYKQDRGHTADEFELSLHSPQHVKSALGEKSVKSHMYMFHSSISMLMSNIVLLTSAVV